MYERLFERLCARPEVLDAEVLKIIRDIRHRVSKFNVVPLDVLNVFVEEKFLDVIADLIQRKPQGCDEDLYQDAIKEAVWILTNLNTTIQESHLDQLSKPRLLKSLMELVI